MRSFLPLALALSLFLSGCGQRTAAPPPLMSPPAGEPAPLPEPPPLPEPEPVPEPVPPPDPPPSSADFVPAADFVPGVRVDLKYAGEDNFTGQVIYDFTEAYLRYGTARKLAAALERLDGLYANGKEMTALAGELSALVRDLLLRKTAPQGGASLMAGGYDEATLRRLGEKLSAQRLLQMLTQLQAAGADLPRSANRRTDAELCLIRLSDEGLDESFAGLSARIARLEETIAQGIPAAPVSAPPAQPERPALAKAEKPAPAEDVPPWEEERPPLPDEPPEEAEFVFDAPAPPAAPVGPGHLGGSISIPAPSPAQNGPPRPSVPTGDSAFWPSFAAGLKGKVPPTVMPYLNNPAKVAGVWKNGKLTLWVDSEFTRSMLNKPAVLEKLARAAADAFGGQPQVSVVTGTPPPAEPAASAPAPGAERDPLDDLLSFGGQFDNITIQ